MKKITHRLLLAFTFLLPVFTNVYSQERYTHLIMYGQSLSTGHESTITLSAENIPGNFMLGEQIWINYGNSNMTNLNPLTGSISKGTTDIVECPLLGAANHIQLRGDGTEKIVATSTGISGTSIEELSKENQIGVINMYQSNYLIALKNAARITKNTGNIFNCPALFWLQGEWNYQGHGSGLKSGTKPTFDKNEYKDLMIKLKNNMQEDLKKEYKQTNSPLFITYQVGAQYTKGKELTIGMAQLEASNEYPDVYCAGPVYPMTDVGGHLDANGYRWYGEMLGKVYYKTKVLGEDFKPLQPKKIYRDPVDDRKLIIQFLVPKLPLVLDENTLKKEKNFGFELYNGAMAPQIENVEVEDDCVIITCKNSLSKNAKIEVVYGSANTQGNGNLRDSDDYPAFFKYQDLDEKNEQGEFIYPRPNNKSLRPSFEPKGADDQIIYGKPYPLYNFSVAFYYVLPANEEEYIVPNLNEYTSIHKNSTEQGIVLRQHDLSLFVETPYTEELHMKIYNLSGQLIFDFGKQSSNHYSLSTLSNGLYLAAAVSSNTAKTQKIVIRR